MKIFCGTHILYFNQHTRNLSLGFIQYRRNKNTGSDTDKKPKKSIENFSNLDAMELVLCLNTKERQYLYNALQKYEFYQIKKEYEGRVECDRWRSRISWKRRNRFLRQEDIESSKFTVPENWIEKIKNVRNRVQRPSLQELIHLSFANALPFIAFGFLDNAIMIVAGESIEINIKAFLVISTMAAAALGNTLSDVVGLWSTHYVERGIEFLGFKSPDLSPYQLKMPISRTFINGGRLVGITVGCLLGMIPLLFFDAS